MKLKSLFTSLAISLFAFSLVGNIQAADNNSEAAKKKEAERAARKAEREKNKAAIDEVLDAKDTNHDGSLTRDEFIAGEANAEAAGAKFDKYNKNGDRALSKSEILEMTGK
ncbi:MAG: hypothetical protein H8M99_09350 [Gloeobacteraceae cyanobacterium ES-bin-144]|nr:hypothetical protein [Verrucomicrobiales bacterium]